MDSSQAMLTLLSILFNSALEKNLLKLETHGHKRCTQVHGVTAVANGLLL